MSPSLKKVLDEAVQIVYLIKSWPLQNCIFKQLCESMGNEYKTSLLRTKIRELSRGKVLARIFELRREFLCCFRDRKFHLSNRLKYAHWFSRLAYLADSFLKLMKSVYL